MKVLVTGANGFIASHVVERLLQAGHEVVGTVRDPAHQRHNFLKRMPGADQRLALAAADLSDSHAFDALTDVDGVMHMASPYVLQVADPRRDLVEPAIRGTLSLLEAASRSPRVRRVVVTSSMAAVTDQPDGRVLTEADWNTRSSLTRNPYYFSKAEAERAAWNFMKVEKPAFYLVVINPFIVIGPSHTAAVNTSNKILLDLVNGQYPAVLALEWAFVDVRDVAAAHVTALTSPNASGRYVCVSGSMSMAEVARLVRAEGYVDAKLPKLKLTGGLGTLLMKLASYTQPPGIGSYLRTHLGQVPRFDNGKIKRELGVTFRSPAESIRETLMDLAKWGHITQARSS